MRVRVCVCVLKCETPLCATAQWLQAESRSVTQDQASAWPSSSLSLLKSLASSSIGVTAEVGIQTKDTLSTDVHFVSQHRGKTLC